MYVYEQHTHSLVATLSYELLFFQVEERDTTRKMIFERDDTKLVIEQLKAQTWKIHNNFFPSPLLLVNSAQPLVEFPEYICMMRVWGWGQELGAQVQRK